MQFTVKKGYQQFKHLWT